LKEIIDRIRDYEQMTEIFQPNLWPDLGTFAELAAHNAKLTGKKLAGGRARLLPSRVSWCLRLSGSFALPIFNRLRNRSI